MVRWLHIWSEHTCILFVCWLLLKMWLAELIVKYVPCIYTLQGIYMYIHQDNHFVVYEVLNFYVGRVSTDFLLTWWALMVWEDPGCLLTCQEGCITCPLDQGKFYDMISSVIKGYTSTYPVYRDCPGHSASTLYIWEMIETTDNHEQHHKSNFISKHLCYTHTLKNPLKFMVLQVCYEPVSLCNDQTFEYMHGYTCMEYTYKFSHLYTVVNSF